MATLSPNWTLGAIKGAATRKIQPSSSFLMSSITAALTIPVNIWVIVGNFAGQS